VAFSPLGTYALSEHSGSVYEYNVLIEFAPEARFGLLKFCELKAHRSDILGLKVDLVMKTGLKPNIGERILQEVIYR